MTTPIGGGFSLAVPERPLERPRLAPAKLQRKYQAMIGNHNQCVARYAEDTNLTILAKHKREAVTSARD